MGNGLKNVEKAVDASSVSRGVPQQTIGDEEGETIGVSTEKEDMGEVKTGLIPEEAKDRNLSDKEREIIETAVTNVNCTLAGLAEMCDWSTFTISETLRDVVPEWYENSFKHSGTSQKKHGSAIVEEKYEIIKPVSDEDLIEYVAERGEVQFNEIADDIELVNSTVHYRLENLVEDGGLQSRKDGNRRYFSVPETTDEKGKKTNTSDTNKTRIKHETTLNQIKAICEYDVERYGGTTFAKYVAETIENGGLETIRTLCEYESRRENSDPVAGYIKGLIDE